VSGEVLVAEMGRPEKVLMAGKARSEHRGGSLKRKGLRMEVDDSPTPLQPVLMPGGMTSAPGMRQVHLAGQRLSRLQRQRLNQLPSQRRNDLARERRHYLTGQWRRRLALERRNHLAGQRLNDLPGQRWHYLARQRSYDLHWLLFSRAIHGRLIIPSPRRGQNGTRQNQNPERT
jgi:hypothetical protein